MNPLVFAQENVVMLESMIEEVKSTTVLDDHFCHDLREDLRYLIENTRLIISLLKKEINS